MKCLTLWFGIYYVLVITQVEPPYCVVQTTMVVPYMPCMPKCNHTHMSSRDCTTCGGLVLFDNMHSIYGEADYQERC